MRQIAICTDEPGWHGARLRAAFAARGIAASYVSLRECRFDLAGGDGIVMPGFAGKLPDAVFVRGVPGGTLEQVTFRLGILHALKALGIPVYNDARAIECTVDKSMTSFLLQRAGVPTPPTWVTENAAEARAVLRRETAAGGEVVIKPLFGSQGTGLRRLGADDADIPGMELYRGVCYLQRYIDSGDGRWHDHRVFVIAGRTVAAMVRRGVSWVNNVARGARCEPLELTSELAQLAEAAARAVGAQYAGVDIVRDQSGCLWVIEVNGIPAWKGLQSVTGVDIAATLADDFIRRHLTRGTVRELAALC
ncbi:MAG: RimK family alpha-L-glutamate ligase [Burkholderiales bacterium]